MDDEIKRTLQELAEGMRQLGESFGIQSRYYNEQFEKDKKFADWQDEDRKKQKASSKEAREAQIKHLGYYRDEFGIIRESIDLRKAENQQKEQAVKQIKADVGEEAFLRKQQQKFLTDEIDKLKQGTDAYGGMVRTIADLTEAQRTQLVDARKQKAEDDKRAQRAERAAKALEAPGEAIKSYTTEHGKQLDSFSAIVGAGKDSLYDMAKGSKLATGGLVVLESAVTLATGAFMGAVKASLAMGKALINGERGMSVSAKGVSAFTGEMAKATKTVGTALTAFGAGLIGVAILLAPFTGGLSLGALALGGLAVGAGLAATAAATAAETLAELNEIAAQLNDKLFAGFNELGKMSMTTAGGMEDVAEKLHKMGMTVAEFDKFKSVVAANTKEMKMFGMSMSDGLTKFTEASAALYESEASKMFQRMGITLEEQYEHTAKYMALQSRLGLLQDKNAKDIAKGTAAYIEELDKIAALTGATRKEQEDARNAVMAIEQLRAGILDEKRKAEQGDPGAKARLEKLERALEVSTQLQAQGLTKAATGTAQYYGAGGRVTTLESAEARRNMGGAFRAIDEGRGSNASRALMAQQEMVEAGKKYAGARRIQTGEGDMAGIISDKSAAIGDLDAKLSKINKAREDEEKKLGRKMSQTEEDKFLKDMEEKISKERKATDKLTNDNIELQNKQRESAIKLDNAALQFSKSVGVNKIASDTFAEAVKKFDEYRKGETGAGGSKLTKEQVKEQTAKIDAEIERFSKKNDMKYKDNQAYVESLKKKKADIVAQGPSGSAGAAAPSGGTAAGPAKPVASPAANAEERLNRLRFKDKGENTGGGGATEALVSLAEKIHDTIPGTTFTALNDVYHQRNHPNSAHTKGTALDMSVSPAPKNAEQSAEIKKQIQSLGAAKVLDEYFTDRNQYTTGGHFHVEVAGSARTGGVFDGPSSGYPVMLHGKEAVVPQANFKDIKKESLTSQAVSTSQTSDEVVELLAEMVETMSEKLDEVISKLGDGNDIQGKILNYSMA